MVPHFNNTYILFDVLRHVINFGMTKVTASQWKLVMDYYKRMFRCIPWGTVMTNFNQTYTDK